MQFDAKDLRDFYRTPLGHVVRRQLAAHIRTRWKHLTGMSIVGVGFASPYLGSFRSEAARIGCFMPSRQGVLVWPMGARCRSVLVEEHQWPLPDNSVDRLLAVHCIEQAERVGPLLREAWRVLAPEGRLLIIVPNRRGVWSHVDTTPFGQGLPFNRSQLDRQLTDNLLTPIEWSEALYFPPFDKRLLLRMAPTLEKSLARLSFGVAGVIIVEARKEVTAPIRGGLKADRVRVLRPSVNLNGSTRERK
ncbi:MAG TPA: methyltransferase domain-containing protein [Hyphomicrobium sp.]|nr:methyltransferase domain-containing protein [Hyphomicrobium sp.]